LKTDTYTSESPQGHETRAQSADSSKAYSKARACNCTLCQSILHFKFGKTFHSSPYSKTLSVYFPNLGVSSYATQLADGIRREMHQGRQGDKNKSFKN